MVRPACPNNATRHARRYCTHTVALVRHPGLPLAHLGPSVRGGGCGMAPRREGTAVWVCAAVRDGASGSAEHAGFTHSRARSWTLPTG